jgi:hypothetical protein
MEYGKRRNLHLKRRTTIGSLFWAKAIWQVTRFAWYVRNASASIDRFWYYIWLSSITGNLSEIVSHDGHSLGSLSFLLKGFYGLGSNPMFSIQKYVSTESSFFVFVYKYLRHIIVYLHWFSGECDIITHACDLCFKLWNILHSTT